MYKGMNVYMYMNMFMYMNMSMYTYPKTKVEPETHFFEKENHLPNLHFGVIYLRC